MVKALWLTDCRTDSAQSLNSAFLQTETLSYFSCWRRYLRESIHGGEVSSAFWETEKQH